MHICMRHPFGSLLGAIQIDEEYVSCLWLRQGPLMMCISDMAHAPYSYREMETQFNVKV